MVKIIMFMWDLLVTFSACLIFICNFLVTGKLSKISVYHLYNQTIKNNGIIDSHSDIYIETNNPKEVSIQCKRKIIDDYISYLCIYDDFKNNISGINFPIYDGNKIVGSKGYRSVLEASIQKYLEELKLKKYENRI